MYSILFDAVLLCCVRSRLHDITCCICTVDLLYCIIPFSMVFYSFCCITLCNYIIQVFYCIRK